MCVVDIHVKICNRITEPSVDGLLHYLIVLFNCSRQSKNVHNNILTSASLNKAKYDSSMNSLNLKVTDNAYPRVLKWKSVYQSPAVTLSLCNISERTYVISLVTLQYKVDLVRSGESILSDRVSWPFSTSQSPTRGVVSEISSDSSTKHPSKGLDFTSLG